MPVLQALRWSFGFLVNSLAVLGFLIVSVFLVGVLYTYVSWLAAEGPLEWVLPSFCIGTVVYSLVKRVQRNQNQQVMPKSETAQIWLKGSLGHASFPSLAFGVAVAVVSLGLVGHAMSPVRSAAVWSLEALGGYSVPILRQLTTRADPTERNASLTLLGELGPRAAGAADWIIKHNAGDERAAVFLKNLQAPAPGELVVMMEKDGSEQREWAAGIIALVPPVQEYAPNLVKLMADPNAKVAEGAASALKKMRYAAAKEAPTLVTYAADPKLQSAAVAVLAEMGDAAYEHADKLLIAMEKSQHPGTFLPMIIAMGPRIVPRLQTRLRQNNERFWPRLVLIEALAALDSQSNRLHDDKRAIFLRIMNDGKDPARFAAAASLLRIEEEVDSAVEILTAGIAEPRRVEHGQNANYAVQQISIWAEPLLPIYQKWLTSGPQNLKSEAVALMRSLGDLAVPAIPDLLVLLRQPNEPSFTKSILATLRAMGPAAEEAAAPIQNLLPAWEPGVQLEAALTLQEILNSPQPLADFTLRQSWNSTSPLRYDVAMQMRKSAKRFGPKAASLVPALDAMYGSDAIMRHEYKEALTNIGPRYWPLRNGDMWGYGFLAVAVICFLLKTFEILRLRRRRLRTAEASALAKLRPNPFDSAEAVYVE